MNKKISFVIPTVNANHNLRNCVFSCSEFHKGYNFEILGMLDTNNSGFAKTINRGLRKATGDILVLLNDDTIFTKDIIQPLIESFEIDKKIGVVGGLLLYPDKTIQHGGQIRVKDYIFYHTDWHKHYDNAYESKLSKYITGVTGAFFAISRECYVELGGLSEKYFNGFEDTEYCINAWRNGFRVYYNSQIELIHIEGATRGNDDKSKQLINKKWFEKEQKSKEIFKEWFKSFSIYHVEKMVDECNRDYKLMWFKYYNEKRITLGIKRSGAIGDCILLTGLINHIAIAYPRIEINVLTDCKDVFLNNPNITNVTSDGHKFHCDVMIDFDMAYEKYPDKNILISYTYNALGIISHLHDFEPKLYPVGKNYSRNLIPDEFKDNYVVLHMAKSWECRTLDINKWELVADWIIEYTDYNIVLLGSSGDLDFNFVDDCILDLRGKTFLLDTKVVIEDAKMFIGMDSSLFHVAQTTKTPCIGIFTCVNPNTRISRVKDTYSVIPKCCCRFQLSKGGKIVTYHSCSNEFKYQCVKSITSDNIIDTIKKVKL